MSELSESQGTGAGGKKDDAGKVRWDLVVTGPIRVVLRGVAAVLTFGARKYAANSWTEVPEGLRRYRAGAERHLDAWEQGEVTDAESGLLHAWHYATNALFVAYLMATLKRT